jgi:hypothetical protein
MKAKTRTKKIVGQQGSYQKKASDAEVL